MRILVPLVATAISINSIQKLLLTQTNWSEFNFIAYIVHGEWISHLWFLIYLLIYFFIVFVFSKFLSRWTQKINYWMSVFLKDFHMLFILLLLPFAPIFYMTLGKVGFPIYWEALGGLSAFSMLCYFPFFLFGMWLNANDDQFQKFINLNFWLSFPILVLVLYCKGSVPHDSDNSLILSLEKYIYTLAGWLSAAICFYIFNKWTQRKSALFGFLSESSYSVYLFHQVFVVLFGLILIKVEVGGILGLALLITVTAITSISIHFFIVSRNKYFRFLFNGK